MPQNLPITSARSSSFLDQLERADEEKPVFRRRADEIDISNIHISRSLSQNNLSRESTSRNSVTGTYIRQLSSFLDEHGNAEVRQEVTSVEERRLNRAISDAGEDTIGVTAVEVWLLDEDASGKLTRPPGGWWCDPSIPRTNELLRLEDFSHPDFVEAVSVYPGISLPGILWAESGKAVNNGSTKGENIFVGNRSNNSSLRGGNIFGGILQVPSNMSNSFRNGKIFSVFANNNNNMSHGAHVSPNNSRKGGNVFGALASSMGISKPHNNENTQSLSNSGESSNNTFPERTTQPNPLSQVLHTSSDENEASLSKKSNITVKINNNASVTESGNAESNDKPPRRHRRNNTWTYEDPPAKLPSSQRLNQSFDHRRKLRLQSPSHDHKRPTQDELQARCIVWRDLLSLVEDPDTPTTTRLQLLESAGFKLAAGVPFDSSGHKGIVIFLSPHDDDDLNTEMLMALANQVYMIRAAESIGSVLAAADAKRAAVALGLQQIPTHKQDPPEPQNVANEKSPFNRLQKRILVCLRKCCGGNLQPQPPMTFRQSCWTLIGCFTSLLILSSLNEYIKKSSKGNTSLPMGPLAALMALQYSLTAAPASQPRNVVLGQVFAGAIALVFTYIPDHIISPWLRVAIVPSIAIALLSKLGLVHPPAAAGSLVLTLGRNIYGWDVYGLLVLASAVSLAPAVLINNLSSKRQYPSYWIAHPNFDPRNILRAGNKK